MCIVSVFALLHYVWVQSSQFISLSGWVRSDVAEIITQCVCGGGGDVCVCGGDVCVCVLDQFSITVYIHVCKQGRVMFHLFCLLVSTMWCSEVYGIIRCNTYMHMLLMHYGP